MQIRQAVVQFLEQCGLRCKECGAWFSRQKAIERELDYEEKIGGTLLMNPFYQKIEVSGCRVCGCVHSKKYLGTEPA